MVSTATSRPPSASLGQQQQQQQQQEADAPAEGNQYASKTELLEWINGLLQLQLSRLEQFASGAVFCQLLDAYFKDAIPMHKVNYHASNEYEAVPNYKVLQQGFTVLQLTREIHVSKLARGSRTELLELLQYMYKYLLKLKAQEGYNARERRALAVRGSIDTVPLPSWMTGSQAAGRGGGMNRSSGNWGAVLDPPQGHNLRTSSSFSPPAGARASSSNPAATHPASGASTTDRAEATTKRPTAPSGSTNRVPAAPAATAGPATPAAATAVVVPRTAEVSKQATQEAAAEDEVGVAVFHVLHKEEELAVAARTAADDPGCTTRLVIPDDAIDSSMMRPLSAGGRAQLELCLGAAQEALRVLQCTCLNMDQITASLPTCTDSYAYRGKVCSLLDASATTAAHVQLLLADAGAVCGRMSAGSADSLQASVQQLQQELSTVKVCLERSTAQLLAALSTKPLTSQTMLNMQLTQLQKQLASTAALDGALRAVGTAYAALLAFSHAEASAVTRQFLQDSSSSAGSTAPPAGVSTSQDPATAAAPAVTAAGVPVATSKVLKLGDCAMKRLRNGDIYKGRYQGVRKNGEGSYCFVNGDVYEGQFTDDRMAGSGVYIFAPEGRYEGDWSGALYEGYGSETFAKGSTYHGQYSAGLRHGWGVCRFFNGDYYEGQWRAGLRDGCGMQQCTDDSNYCGQYRRGKRHGYGVYSFPNGDQYLGEYEDDIPQGYGVYLFATGQRYEGRWEKGKKHGWSIYTVETGQRWAGSWAEGKPQWVHPVVPPAAGDPSAQPTTEAAIAVEVTDNLSHASAACKNAQEACALAAAKLDAHWKLSGDIQEGLVAAVVGARRAADTAQAHRRNAQLLAARLDAAALIIDSGSRSAQMKLVAHQLQGISVDA